MNTMKIAFIIGMFVIGAAFSTLHHPVKFQDRMASGDARRFCDFHYAWRETQAAGGVSTVDRLCFDAQEMKP
jgi:hypothetical protein